MPIRITLQLSCITADFCKGCDYFTFDEECSIFDTCLVKAGDEHLRCKECLAAGHLSPTAKLNKVKTAIDLAEEWCDDQSNGMTDGQISIAALKDIRRLIKD